MWLFSLLLPLSLAASSTAGTADLTSNSPARHSLLHSKTCPRSCSEAGTATSSGWSAYHDLDRLAVCPEPILLKYNLQTPFGDPNTHISIRACTLGDASTEENLLAETHYVAANAKDETNFGPESPSRRDVASVYRRDNVTCSASSPRESETTAHIRSWSDFDVETAAIKADIDTGVAMAAAIDGIASHMRQDKSCTKTVMFAYVRGTLVGLYSGSLIDKRQTSAAALQKLAAEMKGVSSGRKAVEVCGSGRASTTTFGVVADTNGDFAAVQKIMKSWSEASCASGGSSVADIKLKVSQYDVAAEVTAPVSLAKRAECRSIRVEPGEEDCALLASRCGLGGRAFESFNRATPNLCSTLRAGQPVCCSSGTLPVLTPPVGADGVCGTYDVEADEGCQVIAMKHGITEDDLDEFNKKTWGWDGCGNLMLDQRICVTKGKPPMPAPIPDTACGPTKPGSKMPTDGKELKDINPCPLNVCCNVWGNCGTTPDFCTISKTTTGNPGTSKPGENGCQSNCGSEMVNNGVGPAQYRKIAYFEGWNYNRPCLNMHVLDVDSSYTHVHFAFGEISFDHQVVIPDDQREQWNAFIAARNYPKKILAFGGWAFSNEGPEARLLREVVQPAVREQFADRVVRFAIDNNLDGLDFDWEYPGAYDIEGSPPGEAEDGENYYRFLQLVRRKLPSGMSLSIAAPASYWYLRGFPINDMAKELDYIVYMTYDFHGQWDVGNEWAQPGCPSGACLRSHVNSTTTYDSLVMVTKAGVPSHKVVVGVTSYGRSFKMADSNCRGPMCTYLGARNESPAKPGRCTETGGYISDFEINEIIARGGAIKTWYDADTDSDYLVYDQVEWVAYMKTVTKQRRMRDYRNMNFGGTSDWAVDLQGEGSGRGSGRPVYLDPIVYDNNEGAQCQPPCVLVFPPSRLPAPTTISIRPYTSSLEYGAMGTTTINGQATTAFVTRTTTITVSVGPVTVSSMSYSNVNITAGQQPTRLKVTPSIRVGPVSIPVPDGNGGTTTRILTLPPWPEITGGGGQEGGGDDDDDDDDFPPPFPWPPGNDDDVTLPPPVDDSLPTRTTWPPHVITPITNNIDGVETTDDGGFVTPCNLWFFNFCVSRNDKKIGGLKWNVPPGVYPPGPPPPNILGPPGPGGGIQPPLPPLPPWPPITIGRNNLPTYSRKPPCETKSASICSTTTTLSVTTIGGTTSTITRTQSGCDLIYGCAVTDSDSEATTRTDECTLPTARPRKRDSEGDDEILLEERQNPDPNCRIWSMAFYPHDNYLHLPDLVRAQLELITNEIVEIGSRTHSPPFVSVFIVHGISTLQYAEILKLSTFGGAYALPDNDEGMVNPILWPGPAQNPPVKNRIRKRDAIPRVNNHYGPSMASHPIGRLWMDQSLYPEAGNWRFPFYHDTRSQGGQWVFVVGEAGVWQNDPELEPVIRAGRLQIKRLEARIHTNPGGTPGQEFIMHGSQVAAAIVGTTMGVCPTCSVMLFESNYAYLSPFQSLYQLAWTLEHILQNPHLKGKAVVSMSWKLKLGYPLYQPPFMKVLGHMLRALETEAQALLVTSSGNLEEGETLGMENYPPKFGAESASPNVPGNLVTVGAVGPFGLRSSFTQWNNHLTTSAAGELLYGPRPPGYMFDDGSERSGTSFAGPVVAGVAAYLRSLPSPWQSTLQSPANLKTMIQTLHRTISVLGRPETGVPVVWNGQVLDFSCLIDYTNALTMDVDCPYIPLPDDFDGWQPPNWSPRDGVKNIDWSEGPDFPKCSSGTLKRSLGALAGTCGGELCRGYYCLQSPNRMGPPPDFRDPKDPNNGSPPDSTGPSPPGVTSPPGQDDEPCDHGTYTQTTVCGSSSGKKACLTTSVCAGLPPLTGTSWYTGSDCASYSTSRECAGSGGNAACVTRSMCVPTRRPCPRSSTVGNPHVNCPSSLPVCARTTVVDACALHGRSEPQATGVIEAREDSAAVLTQDPESLPAPTGAPTASTDPAAAPIPRRRDLKQHMREALAPPEIEDDAAAWNNGTSAVESVSNLLAARQDNGCPSCMYVRTCQNTRFCSQQYDVGCVKGALYATANVIMSEARLVIWEDGDLVCSMTQTCASLAYGPCLESGSRDCGNGNRMTWTSGFTNVQYFSSRTGHDLPYGLTLDEEMGDVWYPCPITLRLWTLCVDNEWWGSAGFCED